MKITRHGINVAALLLAGRFAEPDDLLSNLEGLSLEDIQFFIDGTNPLEEIAPGGLLGDQLFPAHETNDLDFRYLKGGSRGVVAAQVTSHNSEAPLVRRHGVETVRGSIPAIKQKRFVDALTLIRMQSVDPAVRRMAVDEIYDDVSATRAGVMARKEILRMQALANGIATHTSEEGLRFQVDYGVPANHKAVRAGAARWSQPGADILGDLRTWQGVLLADTGRRARWIVASGKQVDNITKNTAIRAALYGVNSERLATVAEVNALLRQQGLPQILGTRAPGTDAAEAGYDLVVTHEAVNGDRTQERVWPEDTVALIPDGAMGRTFEAPTAEESSRAILPGIVAIDGQRVATRIFAATNDPITITTLAAASSFPSFERADDVFQAVVDGEV